MAFSGKREEASKVDLCKQMEAFESDLNINILTKPIGFQPSEESLAVAAAQKLKNLEEIVYVTPFPSKLKPLDEGKKPTLKQDEPHEGVLIEMCQCVRCLKYREAVTHLYVEECEYNILWFRLQLIIEKHYEFATDSFDEIEPQIWEYYRFIKCPTRAKWLSDGQADNKKNIQISLASNLPLNNDMTLILIFNMLNSRDPHQLFELLCLQAKTIATAFCDTFKEAYRAEDLVLDEVNNYIKFGARQFKAGALKLEPLMADYLKQFNLTWVFVCERIYHRYVTTEVIGLLHPRPFVTALAKSVPGWRKAWKTLDKFNRSQGEVARRKRILEGQYLLRRIKGEHTTEKKDRHLVEEAPKDYDWQAIVSHIRNLWKECDRYHESQPGENICRTCSQQIQERFHAWDCDCPTCEIAGGYFPYLGGWEYQSELTECTACYWAKTLKTANRVVEKDFTYHLSWAVFKHLPGRLEYIVTDLQLSHLCVFPPQSCPRIECLVAQNVIMEVYPKELVNWLLANYRPLEEYLRCLFTPLTSIRNLYVKLLDQDQLEKETLVSLVAELNIRRTIPDKQAFGELIKKYLKATGKDIQIDLTGFPDEYRSDFMLNGSLYPDQLENEMVDLEISENPVSVFDFKSTWDRLDKVLVVHKDFIRNCRFFMEIVPTERDSDRYSREHGHYHNHHHHDHDDHSECCSLFGHPEWTRSRSNETRERLRKRLHQLAQQQQNGGKDSKSAIHKKKIDKNESHRGGFNKNLENVLMKMPQMKDLLNRAGGDRESYSPPGTPGTPDSISEELYRVQCEVEAIQQRFGNISLDAMVDYIEGNRSTKPKYDESGQDKKAAKKLKQKQKKLEQKRTEELQELKATYHTECAAEAQLKAELKSLKAVKKKDKKKIQETELEHKKALRIASKTESAICEIICEIREFNPEFKFNYQPPKEQKGKASTAVGSDDVKVPQLNIPPMQNPLIPSSSMNFMNGGNENAFSQFVAMQRQGLPQFKAPMPMMQTQITTLNDSEDPSKRMVTIRRVNLPHAEPQVTVMAKGNSPDQDRLLYSFINGQMVPAASLDQTVVRNLHQSLQHLIPQMQSTTKTEPEKGAKKQGKKNQKEIEAQKKQEKINEDKAKKNGPKPKEAKPVVEEKRKEKPLANEAEKKDNQKQEGKVEPIKDTPVSKSVKEKAVKNDSKNSKSKDAKKPNPPEEKPKKEAAKPVVQKVSEPVAVPKPKKSKKEPKFEYIDPSFNKNKFDLLCLDEDVGYSESEPESEEEERFVPPKPLPPPPARTEAKQKAAPVDKNNKGNNLATATSTKQESTPSTSAAKSNKKEKKTAVQEPQAEKLIPVLSKKERKRLAREGQKQQDGSHTEAVDPVEKAVQRAEKMAESLTTEMNKLHLNADTTIELINPFAVQNPQNNPFLTNSSIMDQLNKGIKVEGLQLPPGITLTKLDPARAKEIQKRKEAINKISQPIIKSQEEAKPTVIMSNPTMNGMYGGTGGMGPDPGQFVVIESKPLGKKLEQETVVQNGSKNKSKKGNKKEPPKRAVDPPPKPTATPAVVENGSRHGKNKENQRQQIQQKILQGRKDRVATNKNNNSKSKNGQMVTLRNPLFHTEPVKPASQPKAAGSPGLQHQNPVRIRSSTGQVMDTPAAIIQNENGMYTIRNPALHHAYSNNGGGSGSGGMGPMVGGAMYHTEKPVEQPQPVHPPMPAIPVGPIPSAWSKPPIVTNTKAIGSEMKQRQEPWQPHTNYAKMNYHVNANDQQQRSYSPFDSQLNLSSLNGGQSQSSGGPGYMAKSGFSAFVSTDHHGCGGGHNGHAGGHQCEDPHPSALVNDQKYFREPPLMNLMNQNQYADMSFLQNLQPGQRLNSEVTIHNINESKFLANQQQQMPISNHVEITRIPTEKPIDKLAVGSERRSQAGPPKTDLRMGNGAHHQGFAGLPNMENVFAPNERINLNELPSDEREIESFKRFNYFFEPPKNKMKVNLNVQDIYNNSRKPDSPSNVHMATSNSPHPEWDQ